MSREEEMLTAIVQGDPITDEPMCRQEEYLKAIANNSGTANLPEPMCRTEVLLKQIAEVINTGGGSTEGTLNATTIYGVWAIGTGEEIAYYIFKEDGNCYTYSNGQLVLTSPYTINNGTVKLNLGSTGEEFSFSYANIEGRETLANEEQQAVLSKQYYPDKEYSVTENGEYSIPEGATNVSVNVSSGDNITSAIADGTVTSVDLTGATTIRNYAFHNCTQLAEVNMPNVYEIGMSAFGSCPIANIDIPEGCTTIQDNAFEYNSALQSVVFPSTIDWIGGNVFMGAPAEAFTVENGLKYVISRNGDKIYCVGLADTTLTSYPIKSGTTLMCRALFNSEWIANPFSVEIPASLPEITTGAFSSTQLSDITFAENSTLTAIGADAFSNCGNLTSIILPNTITTIEGNSFSGCSNLNSITLPNGITAIEYSTFSYCSSLQNITIPAGVQSIGSFAFGECSSLSTLTILATTPPYLEADAFSGCPISVINIPTGTLESYQSTENWNNFTGLFNEI